MFIINEQDYIENVVILKYTNNGYPVTEAYNKYYEPFIPLVAGNAEALEEIIKCFNYIEIEGLCGAAFNQYVKRELFSYQFKNKWWRWNILSGQAVVFDEIELDCLFSIGHNYIRKVNIIMLFMIKYMGYKYGDKPSIIPIDLIKAFSTYDGHKDNTVKVPYIYNPMGISAKPCNDTEYLCEYNNKKMREYYSKRIPPNQRSLSREVTFKYEGDSVFLGTGTAFDCNIDALCNVFETFRMQKIQQLKKQKIKLWTSTGRRRAPNKT